MGFTVNGHTYEWGDFRSATDGQTIDIISLSYGHGVDPQEARAAGFEARDYTNGQYSAEDAEVEMLMADWDAWRNSIGNGYMRKRFTFTASYADGDDEVTTDTLQHCMIKQVKKNPKQGSDPLTVTVSLKVKKILENGIDPVQK